MFTPVVYLLLGMKKASLNAILCNLPSGKKLSEREKLYRRTMGLTVGTWCVYPLIWILAEGTSVISAQGEAISYTILDIISKSAFGWMIATNAFLENRVVGIVKRASFD